MILSVCCRRQIKTSSLSSWFRWQELGAKAYLDLTFSAVMISSPRWVVQSHTSMLYTPKRKNIHLLVSEIVLCSTTPYSNRRWIPCEFIPVLPNESKGDSLDWLSHAVLAEWSFLRLKFLQIPLLIVCWITELRPLASKTKVSSNWSQKRQGKPSSTNLVTFQMWRQPAKSKNFRTVRHVRVHVWSSCGKAADMLWA